MCGLSSRSDENSWRFSASTTMSVSAVTVAVRGTPASTASSPKKSPGPRVATLRPLRRTVVVPLAMFMNRNRVAFLREHLAQPRTSTGVTSFEMAFSSLFVHSEKIGMRASV